MSKRKKLTDCLDLMEQWDYGKNAGKSPATLSAGSGYIAWWLCEKGHSWEASVNHRHRGTGCPVCANRIVVKGENDLKTVRFEGSRSDKGCGIGLPLALAIMRGQNGDIEVSGGNGSGATFTLKFFK